METNAAKVRRLTEQNAELAEARRVAVEGLEAFRGHSWGLIEKMAKERLVTLHETLVRSDDPESKLRQVQGEARAWDKIVELPRLAAAKVSAIEDKMRSNDNEIMRLQTR